MALHCTWHALSTVCFNSSSFLLLFAMPLHLSKKGTGDEKRISSPVRKRAAAPSETRHRREASEESSVNF